MMDTLERREQLDESVIETRMPAASWGAIMGGAFVIASTALILLALGAGFGLASVSPWPNAGVTATKFATMTAIWLIVVQWLSAGMGGYVAGRLRPRRIAQHVDEVYFRDTAHGILAWAVAAVVTAAVLSSALSSAVSGTARGATTLAASAGAGAAAGAAQAGTQNANPAAPGGYLVDSLFRKDQPDANASAQDSRAETTRILATDLRDGTVPAADKTYLAQLVAARTGVSQSDAEKRVDEVIAKATQAEQTARADADAARKAARNLAFFTAFSMLIGAFIAGVAAKIGGHHRDEVA